MLGDKHCLSLCLSKTRIVFRRLRQMDSTLTNFGQNRRLSVAKTAATSANTVQGKIWVNCRAIFFNSASLTFT
jgi:hypothetical protein